MRWTTWRTIRVGTCAPAPLWRLTAFVVEHFPGELLSSQTLADRAIEEGVFGGSLDLGIARRPFALPGVVSIPFMTEALSVSVPEGHPLADHPQLTFADLAGEQILQYEDVGFWLDVVRDRVPDARLVLQRDRTVFGELTRSTTALFFTSDAPSLKVEVEGRQVVPLVDSEAHATFYLVAKRDAAPAVGRVLRAVAGEGR